MFLSIVFYLFVRWYGLSAGSIDREKDTLSTIKQYYSYVFNGVSQLYFLVYHNMYDPCADTEGGGGGGGGGRGSWPHLETHNLYEFLYRISNRNPPGKSWTPHLEKVAHPLKRLTSVVIFETHRCTAC